MKKKWNKDMEAMADALLGGSLALQATPMLKASGRTTTALAGTTSGFVGIGVAGAGAKTAFGMVKAPYRMGFTKKRKKCRR